MTEAQRIARVITDGLPHVKSGTLRFWGSWFGRPYDNWHEIEGCQGDSDVLTVKFRAGGVLRVWTPR